MAKQRIFGSELPRDSNGRFYHIGFGRCDNPPPNIFLVGDPARVGAVAKHFTDARELPRTREFSSVAGKYKDVPMMVMSTGIGPGTIDIAGAELHALFELDTAKNAWTKDPPKLNIIRLGTSGCPQKDIEIGSVAITTHAIGLDNTTIYYPFIHDDPVVGLLVDDLERRVKTWIIENADLNEICPSAIHVIISGRFTESEIRIKLADRFKPIGSRATPEVVKALSDVCTDLGLAQNGSGINAYHVGATTSAPGFYAPQGRQVGRLSILVPALQEILSELSIRGIRVVNNEMESTPMFAILGDQLGYNVGTICAVLANRAAKTFVPPEVYTQSVDTVINVGLEAMVRLSRG